MTRNGAKILKPMPMIGSLGLILSVCAAAASPAFSADSEITVSKPYFCWLFGGFGFQHSEAELTALMSDEFRDQRVLKTFREISPSFARFYAGYAEPTSISTATGWNYSRGQRRALLGVPPPRSTGLALPQRTPPTTD